MAHTQTETQPRERPPMSAGRPAKLSVAQRAYVAHDPRYQRTATSRSAGYDAVRRPDPRIVVLRWKGRAR